jgi:hypothetical protein
MEMAHARAANKSMSVTILAVRGAVDVSVAFSTAERPRFPFGLIGMSEGAPEGLDKGDTDGATEGPTEGAAEGLVVGATGGDTGGSVSSNLSKGLTKSGRSHRRG